MTPHGGPQRSLDVVVRDDCDAAASIARSLGAVLPPALTLRTLKEAAGAIVGQVDVVDCISRDGGPWFFGPYGFVLRNPVSFARPIPCKGALGFFEVPAPVAEAARQAAAAA